MKSFRFTLVFFALFAISVLCSSSVSECGRQRPVTRGTAVVVYIVESRSKDVEALLNLFYTLLRVGTKFDSFILLHDSTILPPALKFLQRRKIECVQLQPVSIPQSLRDRLQQHSRTREVRDKSIWFQKLAIFSAPRLQAFHRVMYLDLDVLPLRNMTHVFSTVLTQAKPLAAVPEKPGLEPEFQAGLMVFEPKLIQFLDVIAHLTDENHTCGYRADDQSYLCHYFYKRWYALPYKLNVLQKACTNPVYGTVEDWHAIHFNGRKPWDERFAEKNSEVFAFWAQARRLCVECDEFRKVRQ